MHLQCLALAPAATEVGTAGRSFMRRAAVASFWLLDGGSAREARWGGLLFQTGAAVAVQDEISTGLDSSTTFQIVKCASSLCL